MNIDYPGNPQVNLPNGPNDPNGPSGPNGPTGGTGPSGPTGSTGPSGPISYPDIAPVPSTRVSRLTHAQWENTVQDILRLDAPLGFSETFRADPAQAGFIFDDNGGKLEIDQLLFAAYQRAAGDAAAFVTEDNTRLSRLDVSPQAGADQRRDAFLADFLQRAFRRPPVAAELATFTTLYDAGPSLYEGLDAFTAGARAVVEATLQSPQVLYRLELIDTQGTETALDGYTLAQRLSYALWNTTPDDALLAAAADGRLLDAATLEVEVDRLLNDPRAREQLTSFHRNLFNVSRVSGIQPSTALFPTVTNRLGASAQREHDLFVGMLWDEDRSYAELLTSTETFVDAELARIYGLGGSFNDEFVRVELGSEERAGLFTQVSFLAGHATSTDPDPIHRGVFMAERIACHHLGAPPDDITPLPAPMGRTNREVVETHTEDETTVCASCHKFLINPFGFSFENFDAVGAWRDEDRGQTVNAASSPLLGGEAVPTNNALDLARTMAAREEIHACYVEHLVQFLRARPTGQDDLGIKGRIGRGRRPSLCH